MDNQPHHLSFRSWLFPAVALTTWLVILVAIEYTPRNSPSDSINRERLNTLPSSEHLRIIDHFAMQGPVIAMHYSDPYLYLGRGMDGLEILKSEKNKPLSMVRRFSGDDLVSPLAFAQRGNLMYIADRFRGLVILDVANPEKPRRIFSQEVEGIATGLLLSGDQLLLSLGGSGVALYDLANPKSPEEIADFFQFIDYTKETAVYGDHYYLADNFFGGLKVLTRQSNGLFLLVRQIDTDEYCDGVLVVGEILYIRNRLGGINSYSLANPATPKLLSTVGRSFDTPTGMAVVGEHMLASFLYDGLTLISIADPENLTIIDRVNTDGRNIAVCLDGDRVFLADKQIGILVYQLIIAPEKAP